MRRKFSGTQARHDEHATVNGWFWGDCGMSELEAVEAWFRAHDAYHQASDAYNARLAVVRAERDRGNWSMNTDPEYQALTQAQKDAFAASDRLYLHLRSRRLTSAKSTGAA